MYQIVLFIHVFAAVCVIALVLVQQGRGASVGAAFGSGASQTVFGSRGSGSFLFRLTMSLIGLFFLTSIAMNYMAARAYKQGPVISAPVKQGQSPAAPDTSAQKTPATNDTSNTPLQIPASKVTLPQNPLPQPQSATEKQQGAN